MSKRPINLFLPATFEERGTAAPFTTPLLSLSRVRADERHGLVLLMPSFGGSEGAYVVPWKAVPEIATMSVHDRALYDELMASKATSPEMMRVASLKLARTGLAGPAAAAAAKKQLIEDEQKIAETHFLLILSLLSSLGLSSQELMKHPPDSDEWRNLAKTMMTAAGRRLGLDVNTVYFRIGELSRALAPVGLIVSKQDGRLRKLMHNLVAFRDSIVQWGEADRSDTAPFAILAGAIADHTLEIAQKMFRQLDKGVQDVSLLVRDWERQAAGLARLTSRMSWVLDGWDFIIAYWAGAAELSADQQRETVAQLMRILPLIPRNEAQVDEEDLKSRHESFQRKRLRAMEDWRTGSYDMELVTRIEAVKARAVAG